MIRTRLVAIGLSGFVLGALAATGLAQTKRLEFSTELVKGKSAKESAAVLLDGAMQLAENGSWELIAVGRAWYLGGDKAKGQEIFDLVMSNRKVEGSDFFRIGRVYAEAKEWDKAAAAFEKALAKDTGDDTGMIEYGGSYAGAYLLRACKRVYCVTPIRPTWSRPRTVVGGIVEPTPRNAA